MNGYSWKIIQTYNTKLVVSYANCDNAGNKAYVLIDLDVNRALLSAAANPSGAFRRQIQAEIDVD